MIIKDYKRHTKKLLISESSENDLLLLSHETATR